MASDIAFYVVLALLILVIVLFVAVMIKIKNQFTNPLMGAIMTSLHASLFGYESAMIEMIGPRGYRSHVFPKIVEIIKQNSKNSPLLEDILKSGSVADAMQKWMNILGKASVVKDGSVVYEKGDDSFTISIPHCSLCDPIHKMIGEQKGICPMALILTAAGTVSDNSKEATIEYSKFLPTGTVTKVKFVAPSNKN